MTGVILLGALFPGTFHLDATHHAQGHLSEVAVGRQFGTLIGFFHDRFWLRGVPETQEEL